MIVLIPWRRVVVIWLLLSGMLWCGYVGSSLMEGKNPFAPYTLQAPHHRRSDRLAHHQAYSHQAGDRLRVNRSFPPESKQSCFSRSNVRRPERSALPYGH